MKITGVEPFVHVHLGFVHPPQARERLRRPAA
jgi:hypothetical protein